MKISWGAALWDAREATDVYMASPAVEASGLKGDKEKLKVGTIVAGTEALKRALETLLMKAQAGCRGDSSILEMLIPWDNRQGQWQVWNGTVLRLQDKPCVLWMAGRRMELPKVSGDQRTVNSPRHPALAIYSIRFGFFLDFDCVLVLSSWSEKMFILCFFFLFNFAGAHSLQGSEEMLRKTLDSNSM